MMSIRVLFPISAAREGGILLLGISNLSAYYKAHIMEVPSRCRFQDANLGTCRPCYSREDYTQGSF